MVSASRSCDSSSIGVRTYTFAAVLGSWSTYRSERGSVAAWLYGIARNAASDRLSGLGLPA
jgi:hypothetical protein